MITKVIIRIFRKKSEAKTLWIGAHSGSLVRAKEDRREATMRQKGTVTTTRLKLSSSHR